MLTPGISEEIGIGFYPHREGQGDPVLARRMGTKGSSPKRPSIGISEGRRSHGEFQCGLRPARRDRKSIAREYAWPGYFPDEKAVATVAPECSTAYAGEYATTRGLKMTVRRREGSLFLKVGDQTEVEFSPNPLRPSSRAT